MNLRIKSQELRVEKAFTLIELLVVISIIGILVALTMFNFQHARERARDVQRKSELKQIQNALEMYKNDQTVQQYPTTAAGLGVLVGPGLYFSVLPSDPLTTGWVAYSYVLGATNLQYTLSACLENEADNDSTGTTCGTGGEYYIVTQP